jgi:hypothetical protein
MIRRSALQLDLLPPDLSSQPPQGGLFDYSPIPVRTSTFLAGLSQKVHRWFRLTPSFAPDLVQEMISYLDLARDAHIHDPFSGAGTTAIEASLEKFKNSCVEINPFLHFVNRVSLDWNVGANDARASFSLIQRNYERNIDASTLDTIEKLGVKIPPIFNVHRWWRADVLHEILCVKAAINVLPETYRDFFRLCLAAVLVPDLTNVTLGRLQLHFIDRTRDQIDVWKSFASHAETMLSDLAALNLAGVNSRTNLLLGDSIDPNTYSDVQDIDAVITSPPYPNRYSYVWNTRPHLFMFDFVSDGKSASNIDRKTIGGTWGTATSELMKGTIEPSDAVGDAMQGVDERIRAKDNLMANYVVYYFNRLSNHLAALSPKLAPHAKLAYVVGNSWIKDEYIETDAILGRIIENVVAGTKTSRLHRFRRRHSGKNLYESIVYSSR